MYYRSKCKMQQYNILEDSIEKSLSDHGFGNEILDITPKAQPMKEKN